MKFKNTIKIKVHHKYNRRNKNFKNLWCVVTMIIKQVSFKMW